jgi:hypothetical protein
LIKYFYWLFAGKIEKMSGSNPHRLNSKAENEIENGKEPPKYIEEGSGPRKPEKNKKKAPIRTEKPKNVPTLKQQAKPRVETHGRHGESGAEPPGLSSSDDESVGGKHQDDQQRRRREQDQKTARNREEKGDHGFNNENRSPNTSSAAPTDRDPQSLPAQSGTTPAWSSQTTSAPTSLRQVWDASSQFDTAQGHGRGSHMNMPPVGTYSSDQSPQRPGYIQQTSQRSARDRGHGAQHTSQAQAKDRSGTIPVGKLNARGYFGTPQGHGRGIQMNMPPTGGAYSSDQSPHDPSYTQQTTKRS